jgi:hypothetical protein
LDWFFWAFLLEIGKSAKPPMASAYLAATPVNSRYSFSAAGLP